ncbi:MAG: PepSY domain-containing protein [Sphingomonadales bacterium]|nr:PepSY domain-containing protein [Sphingomonadales bacterium]MDE2169843.1 PepSY domain-containing protein [Sphingomonadales bacterium]
MSGLRKCHRWLATLGLPLLIWLAITGTATAFYQVYAPPAPFAAGGAPIAATAQALPRGDAWPHLMQRIILSALADGDHRDARQMSIRLHMLDGRPVGTVVWDDDYAHVASYDAVSGARRSNAGSRIAVPDAPPISIDRLLVGLHSGAFFDGPGQILIIGAGILAVLLTLTGAGLYLAMWRRRAAAGRNIIFLP